MRGRNGTGSIAVIIGSGSAGLTVAIGLASLGRRVTVVEGGPVGGDCTNVGCIPSKTLLHLTAAGSTDPWPEVRARRDGLEAEESELLETHEQIELVRGSARLLGPGNVEITSASGGIRRVRAANVVIAAGSEPVTVAIDGLPSERVLTNETLFDLETTPTHLAIIGGGAIAVEVATAMRRLGSRVSIVEAEDRLLPREDPEVSAIVLDALRVAGGRVHLGTTACSYDDDLQSLHLDGGPSLTDVDRVLMAVGRRPRIAGLGLETVGIEHGRDGITVDSWGRTSTAGVWAVGDVTGVTATTHGANAMARRVVRAIGLPWLPKVGRAPTIPRAVFGDPPAASVGIGLDEMDQRWPEASRLHLRADLADTDRGLTDSIARGAVIVDVERLTGRILRASIVGPGAAEAIGIFTLAIDRRISLHRLYRLVHPYPTFASAIGVVADDFTRLTLPNLPTEAAAWARAIPERLRRRRPDQLR